MSLNAMDASTQLLALGSGADADQRLEEAERVAKQFESLGFSHLALAGEMAARGDTAAAHGGIPARSGV